LPICCCRFTCLPTPTEKRIGTNLDLREEVDAAVEEALRGADVAALPDADPYGTCAISCCNYKEALQVWTTRRPLWARSSR
jgi:hypothetical protein